MPTKANNLYCAKHKLKLLSQHKNCLDYATQNVVNLIQCNACLAEYLSQTTTALWLRFNNTILSLHVLNILVNLTIP